MPQEACIELATHNWPVANMGMSVLRVIGEDDISPEYGGDCADPRNEGYYNSDSLQACPKGNTLSFPIPIDIATDACNCSNKNECMILFGFK